MFFNKKEVIGKVPRGRIANQVGDTVMNGKRLNLVGDTKTTNLLGMTERNS